MNVLVYAFSTLLLVLGVTFFYITFYKMNIQYASPSSFLTVHGISLSSSYIYDSNNFYMRAGQDNYMSFVYAK